MANVLIIDDSAFTRKILRDMLHAGGHETAEAKDGELGLTAIAEGAFDCVLCDLVMPNKDGFAVLESLKDKFHRPPVIVVTADIQESAKKQCLELGAVGFLNKPANTTQILDSVKLAIAA